MYIDIFGQYKNNIDVKMTENLLTEGKVYKPLDAFQIILGMVPQDLEPDLLNIPINQDLSRRRIRIDAFEIFLHTDPGEDVSVAECNKYSIRGRTYLEHETWRFNNQIMGPAEYLQKYDVNIEAVHCCKRTWSYLEDNINELIETWNVDRGKGGLFPLNIYLDWLVSKEFSVRWFCDIIDTFPHLATSTFFEHCYRRHGSTLTKWPLYEKFRKRTICPFCKKWWNIQPSTNTRFYEGTGCPACGSWLEVLPIDVLAAFELWQVRKEVAGELRQIRNKHLSKLEREKKIKLVAETYYSENYISLGYTVFESKVAARISTLSNFNKRRDRSSYRCIRKKCAQIRKSFFASVEKPEGIEGKEEKLEQCTLMEYPFELDIAFTMSLVLPENQTSEDKTKIPIKKQVSTAITENFPEVTEKETINRLSTAILSARDDSVSWYFSGNDDNLVFSGVPKKKRNIPN